MAKYVIAGKTDCPFYAKAEMLGDELQKTLRNFKLWKIPVSPEKWTEWLKNTCEKHEWEHTTSPLIWRELVDRGGKGLYLGGCDEFMEMAESYYGIRSTKMSEELLAISKENQLTKQMLDQEKIDAEKNINPMRITIVSAASRAHYILFKSLLNGEIFGFEQDICLTLYDSIENQDILSGLTMEVIDCASPLLRTVNHTSDINDAFNNTDLVLILDAECSTEDDEVLVRSAILYKQYAEMIEAHAKTSVRILVCGKTSNLFASVMLTFLPKIEKQNILALSRLQENQAKAVLARKLKVNSCGILDLVVWGCPGNDDKFDISMSKVKGYDGAIWSPHIETFSRSVMELLYDEKWIGIEFLNEIKLHNDALQESHNLFPSLSTAAAIVDFLKDWWKCSTKQIISLGIVSDGSYNVPEGVIYSFPVHFDNGFWKISSGLDINDEISFRIKQIGENLKTKTDMVVQALSKPSKENM